jgi:hypothetical protein
MTDWWQTPELLEKLWRNEETTGRIYRTWGVRTEKFSEAFPMKGDYPEGVKLRAMVRKCRREWTRRRRRFWKK